MHVSEPMSDDQPLMRFLSEDKFRRLLDPAPAYSSWSFLRPEQPGTVHHALTNGSLWMARPDTFTDKTEGLFPALNADPEWYCQEVARRHNLGPDEAEQHRVRFLGQHPQEVRANIRARAGLCGVSCWYQHSEESGQMWKDYVGEGNGVAVLTTIKRFEDGLAYVSPGDGSRESKPKLVTVDYVDKDRHFLEEDGYYDLLSIKSVKDYKSEKNYKSEREVRLIGKSPELVRLKMSEAPPPLAEVEALAESSPKGFNLLIDLARLVGEIRVSPTANQDYLDEARRLIAAKGLSPDVVRWSELC